MDETLRQLVKDHKEFILQPRVLGEVKGKILYETEAEVLKRIDIDFHIKKENEFYFAFHFDFLFKEIKQNHPELTLEESILFAADKGKKEWSDRPDAIGWFEQSYDKILDEYAQFLAYKEFLEQKTKVLDTLPQDVKDPLVNVVADSKIENKPVDVVLKWTGTDEQLVKLHNFLQPIKDKKDKLYSKLNYIDCLDFKLFEKHFGNKKVMKKIKWIKPLYELVYLLDNLWLYIDSKAYHETKDAIIPNLVDEHFELIRNKQKQDFIKPQSIYDSRCDFRKSLESNAYRQKQAKKIHSIIQALG